MGLVPQFLTRGNVGTLEVFIDLSSFHVSMVLSIQQKKLLRSCKTRRQKELYLILPRLVSCPQLISTQKKALDSFMSVKGQLSNELLKCCNHTIPLKRSANCWTAKKLDSTVKNLQHSNLQWLTSKAMYSELHNVTLTYSFCHFQFRIAAHCFYQGNLIVSVGF